MVSPPGALGLRSRGISIMGVHVAATTMKGNRHRRSPHVTKKTGTSDSQC